MINVAINGFGRIGRNFLRAVLEDLSAKEKMRISAINIG
ncbi:aldehyde dehydrogenase, partial [bacterium]|nr:aldehyde dehydrogenase [bacterium]